MQISDLLESFKVNIFPEQENSLFAREASERPGMLYPVLLAMDLESQINCIKSSHIFKNAFIDLINLEQIPQAILDHQTGTVLPFDEKSRYPNENNQKYTIIMNMKYALENNSVYYNVYAWNRFYTDQFNKLLNDHVYYIYKCRKTDLHYHKYNKQEPNYNNVSLLNVIIKYLVHKAWLKDDDVDADQAQRDMCALKRECKEITYCALEKDIESLYFKDNGEVDQFIHYAIGLVDMDDFEDDVKIRNVIRQDIDKNVDILVEKLSTYTLTEIYRNGCANLSINLLTNHSDLFSRNEVSYGMYSRSLASVDFYYQKEEYVTSDCDVKFCVQAHRKNLTVNINSLNGSFPNITELPGYFGSNFLYAPKGSMLSLPDFPNVTSIGDSAFYNMSLASIKFGKMDSLTYIGNQFCTSLVTESLELQDFKNVKSIGSYFCKSLMADRVDMRGMNNVNRIGSYFMADMITDELDMPTFTLLTEIGPHYFQDSIIKDKRAKLAVQSNYPHFKKVLNFYFGEEDSDSLGLSPS